MDPLSTAASAIAVISLAIQLAGSVQDIKRLLRGISGAPKEIERILDLLELLGGLLNGIRAHYSKQQEQGSVPDMHPSIMGALRICQSKLDVLGSIFENAKVKLNRSSKVSKTWTSLKLSSKKKYVGEVESQLKQAMSILQMALTFNTTQVLMAVATNKVVQYEGLSIFKLAYKH